jgi:hypothetical protein
VNDFDELIGTDVAGEERARLLGVHELLLEAGPPQELPAGLHKVPRPGELRVLPLRTVPRKVALLAAAIAVLAVTFGLGVTAGSRSAAAPKTLETLTLKGTSAAPHAQATVDVLQEVSGNYPMNVRVSGLPKVAAPQYYVVWLVRDGKPWAPCGQFVVSKQSGSLTLGLTAPYSLKPGDTWIVTRHTFGQRGPGPTVLQPA